MRKSLRRWWLALAASLLALALMSGWAYTRFGRTPGELMDYADVRMDGHPRIEMLVRPFESWLRSQLNAPSASERSHQPFVVPAPPPRRGPTEIRPPEPTPAGVKVWRVDPKGNLPRIANAAALAKDGDVIEIEAGDYRGDVALWLQKRLTIRGVNGAARIFADGRDAEGKAIWVIRRGEFEISNIDFIGARSADPNGAGIRFEGGALLLRDCLFWDNQMGLMSSNMAPDDKTTLTIEGSEFAYSHVDGRWGHNLYVGRLDQLTVSHSYFHHAGVGHLLKSRARVNNILYNRLTDEAGGRASYELEFPNGGIARVIGNVIQQQRATEHSAILAFGAEGLKWPVNQLIVGNNTLINDHPHGGTFLRIAPGTDKVVVANNLLVGPGRFHVQGNALLHNNARVDWEAFGQPNRHDYRLRAPTEALAWRRLEDQELQALLLPQAQYVHPRKLVALNGPPAHIGAEQRTAP